jgi:signal peptide peptidase SppA
MTLSFFKQSLYLLLFFICTSWVYGTNNPFPSLPHSPTERTSVSSLSKQHGVFGNPGAFSSAFRSYGNTSLLSLTLDSSYGLESFIWGEQGRYAGFGYSYQKPAQLHSLHLSFPQLTFSSFGIGANINYLFSNKQGSRVRDWYSNLGLYWEINSFLQVATVWNNIWSTLPLLQESRTYAMGIKPRKNIVVTYQAENNTSHSHFYRFYNVASNAEGFPTWQHNISTSLEIIPGMFVSGGYSFAKEKNTWEQGWNLGTWMYTGSHSLWGGAYYSESQKIQLTLQSHQKKKPTLFGSLSGSHKKKYAILDLNKTIVDGIYTPPWYNLQSVEVGHVQVLQQIRNISQTPGLENLWIKVGRTQCSFAVAEEIVRELQKIPSSIQVTVYMESTSRLQYFLASVADTIFMPPTSYFELQSTSAEVTLYKGLLDKLGIEAQFVRKGKFKSFPEAFTRDSISPEYESDLRSLLTSRWNDYVQDIAIHRNMDTSQTRKMLSTPNILVSRAQKVGLLDGLSYESDLEDIFQGPDFALQNNSPLVRSRWGNPPKVAVLQIDGSITSGYSSAGGLFSGKTTGSKSVVQAIRSIQENPLIEGLILRINSPGGSAVASDVIWKELQKFKESGKPIVATIGGSCASGGYYIATAADYIITNKKSIVGSIGIFGGKYIVRGLYDKIGLRKDVITTTPHGDSRSNYRPWNQEEVRAVQEYMDFFYREFTKRVQDARGFDSVQVDSIAEGRIFTGMQAVENGLADEEGGFLEAIQEMKKRLFINPSLPLGWYKLTHREDISLGQQWAILQTSWKSLQFFESLIKTSNNQGIERVLKHLTQRQLVTGSQELIWAISPEAKVLSEIEK